LFPIKALEKGKQMMKKLGKAGLMVLASISFLAASALADAGGVTLEERLAKVETALAKKNPQGAWPSNVSLSGAVEIEAGFTRYNPADPAADDTDESDVDLTKVELGLEARIVKYVTGQVVFLYEDDDLTVDEGFITLGIDEDMPFYLKAGKMVLPFGNYESHFISDPLPLELGETNEGAAVVGFANDRMDISVGAFNADIDETGDDDTINAYVAAARISLPNITLGAAYISTLAEGGLEDDITDNVGTLRDHIPGYSLFASVSLADKLFLEAEYVAALETFEAGELSFDGGRALEPKAWNLELAYAPTARLEAALRYEGSEDGGDWIPENQYGAVVSYGIFQHTTLALEYLHGEFENDDERDAIVAQLAVEF
jgi:hypothetical protein